MPSLDRSLLSLSPSLSSPQTCAIVGRAATLLSAALVTIMAAASRALTTTGGYARAGRTVWRIGETASRRRRAARASRLALGATRSVASNSPSAGRSDPTARRVTQLLPAIGTSHVLPRMLVSHPNTRRAVRCFDLALCRCGVALPRVGALLAYRPRLHLEQMLRR